MLEQRERDLKLLAKVRAHTDLPFLVELLETHQRRSERLKRPKHAEYLGEVIALLSPPSDGKEPG